MNLTIDKHNLLLLGACLFSSSSWVLGDLLNASILTGLGAVCLLTYAITSAKPRRRCRQSVKGGRSA